MIKTRIRSWLGHRLSRCSVLLDRRFIQNISAFLLNYVAVWITPTYVFRYNQTVAQPKATATRNARLQRYILHGNEISMHVQALQYRRGLYIESLQTRLFLRFCKLAQSGDSRSYLGCRFFVTEHLMQLLEFLKNVHMRSLSNDQSSPAAGGGSGGAQPKGTNEK